MAAAALLNFPSPWLAVWPLFGANIVPATLVVATVAVARVGREDRGEDRGGYGRCLVWLGTGSITLTDMFIIITRRATMNNILGSRSMDTDEGTGVGDLPLLRC